MQAIDREERSRTLRRDPTEANDLRRKLDTVLRQSTAAWKRQLYEAIVDQDVLNIRTQYMTPAERKSKLAQIAAAAAVLAFSGKTPARVAATIDRAYRRGRMQALKEFESPRPSIAPPDPTIAGFARSALDNVVASSVEDVVSGVDEELEDPKTPTIFWRSAILPVMGGIVLTRMRALSTVNVSRAVNAGKIDTYLEQGVTQVGVIPETLGPAAPGEEAEEVTEPPSGGLYRIKTMEDDRVCSICEDLSHSTYTLEEARSLLPAHINCRCVVVRAD